MKNKRKLIKKYLKRYEAMDTGTVVSYFNTERNTIQYIWYKEEDRYLQGPPDFKFFSLKQFYAHSARMLGLKVFW